jgi:hypothetical protein
MYMEKSGELVNVEKQIKAPTGVAEMTLINNQMMINDNNNDD